MDAMTEMEREAVKKWHAHGYRLGDTIEIITSPQFIRPPAKMVTVTSEMLAEFGNGEPSLPGFYWVRLNEPSGPPEWEVAKLDSKGRWWLTGSHYEKHPPKNPLSSNAWRFGPIIKR